MRRIRPFARPQLNGDTVLTMLLVATLVAPLPAMLWGATLPAPLHLSYGALLGVTALAATGYVALGWRRRSAGGAVDATIVAALTGVLSAVMARIIDVRATGFYTEEALFEGVAFLLVLHVLAGMLGVAGRTGRDGETRAVRHGGVRTWRRAMRMAPVTAAAFATFAIEAVALLVGVSWGLMALNFHESALVVLLLAGAMELLVIVLRLPDALRALPRWIAPSLVVVLVAATLALASCATSHARSTPATVAERDAGPGCGVQPSDTVAIPTPVRYAGRVFATTIALHAVTTGGAMSLRLNIPAYRLDVLDESTVVASYGVAVGMRRYRTPVGAFAVHRIVWNPWWVPPKSWWARKDTVTPPGPSNPMGRVKLLIGGPYYVHGTPIAASIGSAASHGCIRMRNEDAIALARRLQARAGAGPDDDELLYLLADTVSVFVDLTEPVPVDIRYAVAELRGDTLLLHPDVYRRTGGRTQEAAMLVLAGASHDTTQVRRRVLSAAVRRARSHHVAIPLDSLLMNSLPDTSIIVRRP